MTSKKMEPLFQIKERRHEVIQRESILLSPEKSPPETTHISSKPNKREANIWSGGLQENW